jgi:hypothetical protein
MFRRLLRAIFRGVFKPNFLLSWRTQGRCGTEHTRDTNSESRQWGRGLTKRTTEQQLHNTPNRRPTKQEIWFKDTPEDGTKQAPKHVG